MMSASNIRATKRFELAFISLAAATGLLGVSAAPPSAADLMRCPKSCGDLNITYPFGIGQGCFHRDFELTCNRSTGTPRLFLGNTTTEIVSQFEWGYIQASIVFNIDTKRGPPGTTYNMSWEAPGRSLSIMWPESTVLVIVGCGVEAYLFDTANLSNVLGYCEIMCGNMVALKNEAEGRTCDGMGCCNIEFQRSIRAFTLSIIKKDVAVPLALANATVKAFLSYVDYSTNGYNFSMADLMSDKVNTSTIGAVWAYLSPVITDQPNCRTAQLHERYACAFGYCTDYADDGSGGYSCSCTNDVYDDGNPYVVNGCLTEYKPSQEKFNCSRLCGNTSIPFPFGLEPGCSANWMFELNCTANKPFILSSRVLYHWVADISVEEGLLLVKSPLDPQDANKRMTEIYITSFHGFSLGFYQELIDFDITEQSSTWKWAISNATCDMAKNSTEYACISGNSECVNVTHGLVYIGYRCKCKSGYEGNPYVRNGCNDTNECLKPYVCNGTCYNWDGGYNCTGCPHGKAFDPTRRQCTSTTHHSLFFAVAIGLGCGFGVLALTFSITILTQQWKQHIKQKIRREYFQRNKGLLLEQLISSNESATESTKIFSFEELEMATNCFDSRRIVGCGGHGTVYKGILSDQRVVAIKKSKIIVQSEINQFINEVSILSQIIHRNVVKLFGCCLESEVPLLVYEFISNGTLYDHLHGDLSTKSLITWENRTRIALEAATALAYLHSAASIPIFHRDVKSTNILLNDSFTAKVSDFGASRSISVDETHVVTIVQGTFGYIDPEYYHTGQLNEKSDVYSFGVILVELLTRRKPIFLNCFGEKQNLSHCFLQRLQNKTIVEILDPQVIEEANLGEIDEMASLAEICLKLQGEERPTMREVELRLQLLRGMITRKTQEDLHVDNTTESSLGSKSISNSHTPYIELGTISNSATREVTRCYTMEKELISWSDIPR